MWSIIMERRVWPVQMASRGVSGTRSWELWLAWLWLKDEICPGRCWAPCDQSWGLLLMECEALGVDWSGNWVIWVLWLYYSRLSSHYWISLSFLLKSAVVILKEERNRNQSSSSHDLNSFFFPNRQNALGTHPAISLHALPFSLPPIQNQMKSVGGCVGLCWLRLWIGPNISFFSSLFSAFWHFSPQILTEK